MLDTVQWHVISGGKEADLEMRKAYQQAMKPALRPGALIVPMASQFRLLHATGLLSTKFTCEDTSAQAATGKGTVTLLCAHWIGCESQQFYNVQLVSEPRQDPSADEAVLAGK